MTAILGKFAPCAIVLAAVTYCCWPYLEDAGQRTAAGDDKKLPEIAANVLAPKIKPAPGRDPFGMTGNVDLFKVVDTKAGKKETTAQAYASGKAGIGAAGDRTKGEAGEKPAKEVDPEVLKKATRNNLIAAKNNLTLMATIVRGERRAAMINGQRFKEGETLERANSNVRMVKLAKILHKQVILEQQGQTIELGYPDPFAKAATGAAQPGSSAPAKPAVPPRATTRQATPSGTARPAATPRPKPRAAARATMTN